MLVYFVKVLAGQFKCWSAAAICTTLTVTRHLVDWLYCKRRSIICSSFIMCWYVVKHPTRFLKGCPVMARSIPPEQVMLLTCLSFKSINKMFSVITDSVCLFRFICRFTPWLIRLALASCLFCPPAGSPPVPDSFAHWFVLPLCD